ncbi:MAG: nuclear transport factor 2 family protein [Oleiphilaceae bacterium]|nr:nuclear transport factor 2 family protein [Oleiphilaceae bacterium]
MHSDGLYDATSPDYGQSDFSRIIHIVGEYFKGLHHGEPDTLAPLFHADTVLKAPNIRRTLTTWLDDVSKRAKPIEQGAGFNFRLLSLEITGDQAMAKVACPLFQYNYVDYLGLLKEGGHWRIVNKMYADLSPPNARNTSTKG